MLYITKPRKKTEITTIAYIIDFLATREGTTGGTERQLIEIINHLDRSKFRPILFCLQDLHESPLTPLWKEIKSEKYMLHVYSLISVKSVFSLFSFAMFLSKNNVSIMQTFFFDSIIFGTVAAKLAGIKNIISCRRDMGFWYNDRIVKILSIFNKFAKNFLVNSEAIKYHLIEHEKIPMNSIDVIYNGIDFKSVEQMEGKQLHDEFENVLKSDKIIGLVANFNRKVKRADIFIKAAAEVIKKIKKLKFIIVGGGSLKPILTELITDLKIEDSVIFAGPQKNAIPFIKGFTIGTITSESEGFSNVILEYMACGIPVIATNVGGNRELVEDGITGLLFPSGDFKGLSEAIYKLVQNPGKCKKMGEEAKRIVSEKYGWKRKIQEIESYYRSLLEK